VGLRVLLSLWAVVPRGEFPAVSAVGDLGRLLLFATLENFGYRQRTVWWRVKAFWSCSGRSRRGEDDQEGSRQREAGDGNGSGRRIDAQPERYEKMGLSEASPCRPLIQDVPTGLGSGPPDGCRLSEPAARAGGAFVSIVA